MAGGSRDRRRAVRDHLLSERADLLAAVLDCADAVAAGWSGAATADRDRIVGPMRACLDRAGAVEAFPAVLAECVAAAGGELRAEPVAAPPYVAVTSVGPVLRATLGDGQDGGPPEPRLVVTVRAFAVERGAGTRYVRGPTDPAAALEVELR